MNEKPSSGGDAWVDPDDAPELTPEHFDRADWYIGETLIRRGRPPTGNAKRLVSLRIDQDVLQRLRDLGPGWQTRANDALRAFVDQVAKT
ncbi:MAG: BrnA antitoxin family protein [Acetobacteraceae bacterium]